MKTIITILLILAMILQGCSTNKMATRHLFKATAKNPLAVANWCSSLYPPVTLIKDSVVYKPGVTPGTKYVYADCDSLLNITPIATNTKIKIPCPVGVQTDTIMVFKEKQIVNRAQIEALTTQLNNLTAINIELNRTKKNLLYFALILGLYTGVRWLLRILKIKLP